MTTSGHFALAILFAVALQCACALPGMDMENTMVTQAAPAPPAAMRTHLPPAMATIVHPAPVPMNTARTMGGSDLNQVCAAARTACASSAAGQQLLTTLPGPAGPKLNSLAELVRLSNGIALLSGSAATNCQAYLNCIEPEDCAVEVGYCVADAECSASLRTAVDAWESASNMASAMGMGMGPGMATMGMAPAAMGTRFADPEALKYLTLLLTDATFRDLFSAAIANADATSLALLQCAAPTPTPSPFVVNAAVRFNGVSEAEVTAPVQAALSSALAAYLGVAADQLDITSIVASSGPGRSGSSVTVYFTVTLPYGSSATAQDDVSADIQNTSALTSAVNAAVTSFGVTVTDSSVVSIVITDPEGNEETDV